jgi:hypothetical protein
MQLTAMAHTAKFSASALEEIFDEQLVTHGLLPPRFIELNLCGSILGGTLKDKGFV